MIDIHFENLRHIGLSQYVANHLGACASASPNALRLMRIVETQRDWFTLHDGEAQHRARAAPRLLQALQQHGVGLTVGDWVLAEIHDGLELWIAERLPPVTLIARRANDGRRQPLASNVDTALLAMGLDDDFSPRRMERYIALVRASDVAPVVVLTKADIGIDVEVRIAEMRQRLPASVPLVAVNGMSAQARLELAPWLGAGQTLVLLGSSGAGKSTLTNTLTGEPLQDTGPVRLGDGRGRHTTTARSLHQCPEGACIIDTPGLRTWRPDADADALAAAFDDIAFLSAQCQFRDCRHQGEPGCAVRAGVDGDRLRNYGKLLRDAERGEQSPLERIRQRGKWKALGKAGNARARGKRP
ncbi:MAG: ribosome small subunit-dependent GTPase A [Ramlibacter sp.]